MRHHTKADAIHVYGDEDGWHLIVETEDGDTFDFRIHELAWDFAANVDGTIGYEKRYADGVRAEVAQAKQFACDPDESGGYETNSPKHPGYRYLMSEHYDNRDRGER